MKEKKVDEQEHLVDELKVYDEMLKYVVYVLNEDQKKRKKTVREGGKGDSLGRKIMREQFFY